MKSPRLISIVALALTTTSTFLPAMAFQPIHSHTTRRLSGQHLTTLSMFPSFTTIDPTIANQVNAIVMDSTSHTSRWLVDISDIRGTIGAIAVGVIVFLYFLPDLNLFMIDLLERYIDEALAQSDEELGPSLPVGELETLSDWPDTEQELTQPLAAMFQRLLEAADADDDDEEYLSDEEFDELMAEPWQMLSALLGEREGPSELEDTGKEEGMNVQQQTIDSE